MTTFPMATFWEHAAYVTAAAGPRPAC